MEPLIIGTNGAVAAIEPTTGAIKWKTMLKTGGLISATHQEDISVLVRDGIVFAGGAGHLFCIDAENGEILWHNPLEGFGHNDISLAMEGISVQFLAKVQKSQSS